MKAPSIPAELSQLRALESEGLITIDDFSTANTTSLHPTPALTIAARNNFGLSKRLRVLKAIHEAANGKPGHAVLSPEVQRLTGLDKETVCAMGADLERDGCISADWDAQSPGSYRFMLKGKGITLIENPEDGGKGVFINNMPGAVVQTGEQASARIFNRIQQVPAELQEQLTALRREVSDLENTDRALGKIIDDILTEMMAGREAQPGKVERLVEMSGKLFELMTKVTEFLKAIGSDGT